MNQRNYYYLIGNEIKKATSEMPNEFSCRHLGLWNDSLQPCEITQIELEKVKKHLSSIKLRWDEVIEVTDIVDTKPTEKIIGDEITFSHTIVFKQPKSESEHPFEDYKKQMLLHSQCDEQCFYGCSKGGTVKPKCLNSVEPKSAETNEAFESQEILWKEVDRIFARHKSESLKYLKSKYTITRNKSK